MKQTHRPTAEAFERLCAPYSGMVYRHCLHMLGNPHEAEDAAQESMLRAFRAFDSFRGDAVASWLFRIAHNTCLDILKSARVRRESLTLDDPERTDPADPSPTPDEAYLRDADIGRMRSAVASLPKEQQLLIGLFYGQQMGYAEIAQATGLREGTVKSRLSRARVALEKKLTTCD